MPTSANTMRKSSNQNAPEPMRRVITSPAEFQILIGKKPWRVWKGVGSFLLFEFGRRHRAKPVGLRGTYTLWIQMADWRFRDSEHLLAHSDSPDEQIHHAAETLTHKRLESIVFCTVVLKGRLRYGAAFHFEGRHTLRATMYERSKDDTIFMLYAPTVAHSYNTDGTVTSAAIDR